MKGFSTTVYQVAVFAGLLLGAFAISASATGTWKEPACGPAGCNTSEPINISDSSQSKLGAIAIGKIALPTAGYSLDVIGNGFFGGLGISGLTITNTLQVQNGAKDGYVLTSDTLGNATWQALAGGGSGNTFGGSIWEDVPLTDTSDYDQKCQYRFTINTSQLSAIIDTSVYPGPLTIFYANAVHPKLLIYVSHSNVTSYIKSVEKKNYYAGSTLYYTLNKMEKFCGGSKTAGGGTVGNYKTITKAGSYTADCPVNSTMVSGGCWCVDATNSNDSSAYGGRPTENGWECIGTTGGGCSGGITTYARCVGINP